MSLLQGLTLSLLRVLTLSLMQMLTLYPFADADPVSVAGADPVPSVQISTSAGQAQLCHRLVTVRDPGRLVWPLPLLSEGKR